jgi:hypothetical protein
MKLLQANVSAAHDFFVRHMHAPLQAKRSIYESRGVRLGCVIPPSDWEVFASILLDKAGNGTNSGVDLVESASNRAGYEYQYHKETGLEKLTNDSKCNHLFIDHSDFLNKVTVRMVHGNAAKTKFFDVWRKNYPNPYPQRYRKQIPFKWVESNANVLLVIENGKLVLKT